MMCHDRDLEDRERGGAAFSVGRMLKEGRGVGNE